MRPQTKPRVGCSFYISVLVARLRSHYVEREGIVRSHSKMSLLGTWKSSSVPPFSCFGYSRNAEWIDADLHCQIVMKATLAVEKNTCWSSILLARKMKICLDASPIKLHGGLEQITLHLCPLSYAVASEICCQLGVIG